MENSPDDRENVSELVQADLKGDISDDDVQYLKQHPNLWRSELLTMKLSCEAQMVAANARRFQNHYQWSSKEINSQKYYSNLNDEKTWKCHAARFLQQIENRLRDVNGLTTDE